MNDIFEVQVSLHQIEPNYNRAMIILQITSNLINLFIMVVWILCPMGYGRKRKQLHGCTPLACMHHACDMKEQVIEKRTQREPKRIYWLSSESQNAMRS